MTRRGLARALGVDESSIRDWEDRSDAPKEMTVEAWKPYIEASHLAKGMTRKSYAELREEKIKEEIDLLRLKKLREEGRTLSLEDVQAYLSRLSARWDQLLTLKLETEIPARIIGKDIVAARAEARAVHDEIREICNAGIVEAEKDIAC